MKHVSSPLFLLTLGVCTATVGLFGCDDDEGGGAYDAGAIPEHFDPGVAGDTALDDLSTAEAKTLCDNSVAWGQDRLTRDDEALHATCIAAGYSAAVAPGVTDATAACEEAVTACKQGPFPTAEVCDQRVPALMGCGEDVQDYQDCFEAQTLGYIAKFKELTCDGLQSADLTLDTPASCEALWTACPALDERPPGGDGDGDGDADAGM